MKFVLHYYNYDNVIFMTTYWVMSDVIKVWKYERDNQKQ